MAGHAIMMSAAGASGHPLGLQYAAALFGHGSLDQLWRACTRPLPAPTAQPSTPAPQDLASLAATRDALAQSAQETEAQLEDYRAQVGALTELFVCCCPTETPTRLELSQCLAGLPMLRLRS